MHFFSVLTENDQGTTEVALDGLCPPKFYRFVTCLALVIFRHGVSAMARKFLWRPHVPIIIIFCDWHLVFLKSGVRVNFKTEKLQITQ